MTLIFILIALGLDYFLGKLQPFRNYEWVPALYYSLEKKISHYRYWDGTIGLLGLLLIPILLLLSVMYILDQWSWFAETLFTLLVLIYCLAPEELDNRLDDYITAIDEDDSENIASLSDCLINDSVIGDEDTTEQAIIKSSLTEAHRRVFAVIFWFLILGLVGALLYRLVDKLNDELSEIRSGFSDSVTLLLNILEWPTSRIFVVGLGLAGSLVDAFNGWRQAEHFTFEVNNEVLSEGGFGALQYMPDIEVSGREKSYWISELKSLINRTLIIWLAVLGIMTLSGNLG